MRLYSRHIVFLLLIIAVTLLIPACGGQNPSLPEKEGEEKTLTIATSFYPMYIAALNITKDVPGVRVVNVAPPQAGCLHDYQLKPDDLKTLGGAQIFIINGAGMESFMDKVIAQLPDLEIIEAGKGMELIKEEGEEDGNPHLWVSVTNAIQQQKNIARRLSELDPDRAARYAANNDAYVKKLEALREKMHRELDTVKTRDIITFHEAFPYFAEEFNLNIAAVIEREPGSEPGAAELAETIELIDRLKIKALFAEPQYSSQAADTIARETGARLYILDPAVTGPMEPDAYIKIMESNLKVLKEALN